MAILMQNRIGIVNRKEENMDKRLVERDVVMCISKKLAGERIVVGGNKEFYKRKYHLKYTQKIIEKILETFWDVVAEELAEGNSIVLKQYVRIEPNYCKERKVNIPEPHILPAHFNVKFKPLGKLKQACKNLTEKLQ